MFARTAANLSAIQTGRFLSMSIKSLAKEAHFQRNAPNVAPPSTEMSNSVHHVVLLFVPGLSIRG